MTITDADIQQWRDAIEALDKGECGKCRHRLHVVACMGTKRLANRTWGACGCTQTYDLSMADQRRILDDLAGAREVLRDIRPYTDHSPDECDLRNIIEGAGARGPSVCRCGLWDIDDRLMAAIGIEEEDPDG